MMQCTGKISVLQPHQQADESDEAGEEDGFEGVHEAMRQSPVQPHRPERHIRGAVTHRDGDGERFQLQRRDCKE